MAYINPLIQLNRLKAPIGAIPTPEPLPGTEGGPFRPLPIQPESGRPLSGNAKMGIPCEEGYVLDTHTDTCVPIQTAMQVAKGDNDRDRFQGAMSDGGGGGGYISFQDMFDGGGPGQSGPTFEGLPYVSDALNEYGVKPLGYYDRLKAEEAENEANLVATAEEKYNAGVALNSSEKAAVANQAKRDRDSDNDKESFAEKFHREAREKATGGGKGTAHKSGAIKKFSGPRDKGSAETYGITKEHMGGGSSKKSYGPGGKRDPGNKKTYGLNMGGLVSYKQAGGDILPGAVPPTPQPLPGAVPPGPPPGVPMDPGMAQGAGPMPPPAPVGPPPRKSFTERVMEAKELIKSGATPLPSTPLPQQGMMDAQGDGPVMIHPEAGLPSPAMVGPDMGPDTFDAELEEGSMVMNPEASEMFQEELMGYFNGGMV